jgi:DNA-binding transcriptional ArsR family regulator
MDSYGKTSSKLKVMGHPVRLHILDMLRRGETCVCHIEQALGRRQSYVSQQLMTLRSAGLVDSRKDGLQVYYRLTDEQVVELLDLLAGPSTNDGLELLDGCHCPSCSAMLIAEIE